MDEHEIERESLLLEEQAAQREFSEAFRAFQASGARMGSPEDYAMWNAASYSTSAERATNRFLDGEI